MASSKDNGSSRLIEMTSGRREFIVRSGAVVGAAAMAGTSARSAAAAPGTGRASRRALGQDEGTTLRFGMGTDADYLDPRQINTQEAYVACANIYDTITLYDLGAATIRPGLAESWEISEDGLTYTFALRQGVTFHDGTPFNADAIVTWFTSISEGVPGSQYDATRMPYMAAFITDFVSGVEKVDDATVVFSLPAPYSPLLANLAIPIAAIPSPAAIEQYGLDLGVNPSGTGAFMLASPDDWTRDSQIVLAANPNYWGGAPAIQQLVMSVTPESSTRLQQIEAGEIDIAIFLTPDDVRKARDNSDLVIVEQAGLNTNCVEFNVTKDPFTTKEVRQALNYAINKEDLSAGLYDGGMVVAGGVLPPSDWAYNPELRSYPYDPDKAKELLAGAGYGESNPLSFTFMAYTIARGYNPAGDRLATAIQEYWKEVGVEAEIQSAEWTQYRTDRRANMFQVSLSGWQGDNGDPDNFLFSLLGGPSKGAANTAFYENPDVDALLVEAQQVSDQAQRTELYHQAEQLIVDDAPWAFLGYQKHQVVTRGNVANFQIQPTYIYYLAGVSKS